MFFESPFEIVGTRARDLGNRRVRRSSSKGELNSQNKLVAMVGEAVQDDRQKNTLIARPDRTC